MLQIELDSECINGINNLIKNDNSSLQRYLFFVLFIANTFLFLLTGKNIYVAIISDKMKLLIYNILILLAIICNIYIFN